MDRIPRLTGRARHGAPGPRPPLPRAVAFLVAVAVLLAGCTARPGGRRDADAVTDGPPAARDLERAWVSTGPGEGGYAAVNLAAPPSLYQTAWTLRLAAERGIAVPALAPDQAAAWLTRLLSDPGSERGLPRLEVVRLAVHALLDLHRPPPRELVAGQLERLRLAGRYREDQRQAPSWAATAAAVDVLGAARLPVPAGVVRAVALALPHGGDPNGAATLHGGDPGGAAAGTGEALALWQAADQVLPAAATARRAAIPGLRALLGQAEGGLTGGRPLDGAALGLLDQARQVAVANAQRPPVVPPAAVGGLGTPTGMLALSGAAGVPDPQVTCVAGRLGLPLDLPRLGAAVRASATPRGWAAPAHAVPDPQTSYAGAALAHDWNDRRHDADLRRLLARWLRELAATPPARLAGQLTPASYTVGLARLLGVPLPAAARDALRRAAPVVVGHGDNPGELLAATRVARLTGLPPPAGLRQAVDRALTAAGPAAVTATGVALLAEAGRALSDQEMVARAARPAARLRSGPAYTVAVGAPRPDIVATADALDAVAAGAAARRTAVRPFTDASGTWRWPVGHPGENVRDLWSLYLGARLAAGRSTVPS
jgi:hypothetical protein